MFMKANFDSEIKGGVTLNLYYIKGFNDETNEFDCGIATTEVKATQMVEKLTTYFEGSFEFKYYKQKANTLILTDGEKDTKVSF